MQDIFAGNEAAAKLFRATLSEARFARYLTDSNGNECEAIKLYLWNCRLSQAMYLPLQAWEIGLRNKLNSFLIWKFGADWPTAPTAQRQLTNNESRRLRETIERQRQLRGLVNVPTDAVVADLSAGFWVALLASSYDVPFAWRYNLGARVFPNEPKIVRGEAHDCCDDVLNLRNRVAHHEPIYHMPLADYRADLDWLLGGMCTATQEYTRLTCTFERIWDEGP